MPITYDCIVVGAGIAGLQAARDLQSAGLECVVLEARDRIGGKTLTRRGKIQQELGAAWINDTNQSRMWALAQELGLHTYEQNVVGDVVVEDFDGKLVTFPYGEVPEYPSSEDTEQCVRIRDLVEATSKQKDVLASSEQRRLLDSMSFEQWLHLNCKNEKARATAQVWTHAMLGVDPSEVSALYYLEYCHAGGGLMTMRSDCKDGGQYLRLKEGTSAFAEGLSSKLKPDSIRLQCPVIAITQNADGTMLITTKNSAHPTFLARKVIVSVPTPIYKTITFTPALPPQKTAVVNRTRYGFYCKYILAFKRPFWRDRKRCGLAQSFIGPVSVFRDTSVDDEGTWCFTCFIGGGLGRRWVAQTAEQKLSSVLKQISSLFADGEDVTGLFVEAMESPWMEEEWSGWGCPCPVMPPHVLADGGWEALCAPHGNVSFIGTELASVWRGYMEGAIRTGEHGAAEVIAALQKIRPSQV